MNKPVGIVYLLSFIKCTVYRKGGIFMTDNIIYQLDKSIISQQKMQFNVINRRPKYAPKERQTVKAEIEKQLFAVFCNYVRSN